MKKIKVTIAQSWNELTTWQLKTIAALFHRDLTPRLFDAYIFYAIMDVRWWQFYKRYKVQVIIRNVGMTELKKHYSWLYKDNNLTKFIPQLMSKNGILFSPMARLINLTIDEFAHTEDLFLGFNKTKKIEYLRYLAAVLYRENDSNGKRIPFEKNELDARALALSKIDNKTLFAIGLTYQGCRNYMYPKFPHVFPQREVDPEAPAPVAPSGSNLGKLVLALSGAKFGTHNETKSTNLYIFMSEFEEQLKAEKQKPKPRTAHA